MPSDPKSRLRRNPLGKFWTQWTSVASSRDAVRLPVVISGGKETDSRGHGRPGVLVDGGLGVSPVLFVPGARSSTARVNLSSSQDLSKNGSIASVTLLK